MFYINLPHFIMLSNIFHEWLHNAVLIVKEISRQDLIRIVTIE